MRAHETIDPEPEQPEAKRPYHPPVFREYGDVRELTLAAPVGQGTDATYAGGGDGSGSPSA